MKLTLKYFVTVIMLMALTSTYADTEWFVFSTDGGRSYGFLNPGTGETRYEGMFTASPSSIFDGVFVYLDKEDGVSVYSAADPEGPQVRLLLCYGASALTISFD